MEFCWIWEIGCNASNVAAWAQAIGSIGAVIAAIFVSARQHKNSMQMVHQEYLNSLERLEIEASKKLQVAMSSLYFSISNAKLDFGVLLTNPERCVETDIRAMYNGTCTALEKFPIYDFPIAELTHKVIEIPNAIRSLFTKWEYLKTTTIRLAELRDHNSVTIKQIRAIIRAIDFTQLIIEQEFVKRKWDIPKVMQQTIELRNK